MKENKKNSIVRYGKIENTLSDIIPPKEQKISLKPFVLRNETPLRHEITRLIAKNESKMNKILQDNPEIANENNDTYACGKFNTLYLQNAELKNRLLNLKA